MKRFSPLKDRRSSVLRRARWAIFSPLLAWPLSSCGAAPTLDVDGSFLPAWMLCGIAGLVGTYLIHWQVTQRRMQERIRPAVVFYPSVAVGIASLLWLLLFR